MRVHRDRRLDEGRLRAGDPPARRLRASSRVVLAIVVRERPGFPQAAPEAVLDDDHARGVTNLKQISVLTLAPEDYVLTRVALSFR